MFLLALDRAIALVSIQMTFYMHSVNQQEIFIFLITGQKFAMMEEKVILASIFRKFQVTALDKPEDLTLLSELILRPRDGIRLRLTPRQSKVHNKAA